MRTKEEQAVFIASHWQTPFVTYCANNTMQLYCLTTRSNRLAGNLIVSKMCPQLLPKDKLSSKKSIAWTVFYFVIYFHYQRTHDVSGFYKDSRDQQRTIDWISWPVMRGFEPAPFRLKCHEADRLTTAFGRVQPGTNKRTLLCHSDIEKTTKNQVG